MTIKKLSIIIPCYNEKATISKILKEVENVNLGKVTKEEKLLIHGLNQKIVVDASLAELRRCWKKTLSGES